MASCFMKKVSYYMPFFFLLVIILLNNTIIHAQDIALKAKIDSVFLQPPNTIHRPVVSATPASHAKQLLSKPAFKLSGNTNASNVCGNSSQWTIFEEDSVDIYAHSSTILADGNILFPGLRTVSGNYQHLGYLLKCTPGGDTIWIKNFGGPSNNSIVYNDAYELNDNGILLVGKIRVPVPVNSRYDMVLTKLTANGDFLWQRTYISTFVYMNDAETQVEIYDLRSTASGDIYFCGGLIAGGFSRDGLAGRLSSNGSVVWCTALGMQGSTEFVGFHLTGNELRAYGNAAQNTKVMTSFDITTGDTVFTKKLIIPVTPTSFYDNFRAFETTELDNGNIMLSGRCITTISSPDPNNIGVFAGLEVTPSFDFVDAWRVINNHVVDYYSPQVKVYKNKSVAYAARSGNGGLDTLYVGRIENNIVVKERTITAGTAFIYGCTNFVPLAGGGDGVAVSISHDQVRASINFLALHNTDTSGSCLGNNAPLSWIQHLQYVPVNRYFDSIETNMMQEVFIHPVYIPYGDGCMKTLNCNQGGFCDSLKLTAASISMCLPSSLNVDVYTNNECGSALQWLYNSASVGPPVYINDTTVQINFTSNYQGWLTAQIAGCSLLKDSFYITVTNPQPAVYLGPDQNLCTGNTILLNAHSGYATYLWQDNSTDSLFTVTAAGTYYVTATDACGLSTTDTVHVTAVISTAFSAGPDRSKCNGDTLHLTATGGFSNYTWSNNYYINTTSGQSVIVNPPQDTVYYVRAQNSSGCIFRDTVRVMVFYSPAIDLGSDVRLCPGDSAAFDAGTGFLGYLWNTGVGFAGIFAQQPGEYVVIATTADGCISTDTVHILNPFPSQAVQLDKDTTLCINGSRILDAGNFTGYQWNTGATGSEITVNSLGMYAVTVTDNNGCKASDSVHITTLYPSPSGFLPGNSSVCSYQTMEIVSTGSFSQYLWNTGATTPSINISQPGVYWLQVTGLHACKGKDSIHIKPKDCLHGFYIPNAFTPNSDTKNDLFRPMLFGPVVSYDFSIYDRWGKMVFHSTDFQAGWDGSINGLPASPNSFIWICSYQLAGEKMKTAKGSVLIVR